VSSSSPQSVTVAAGEMEECCSPAVVVTVGLSSSAIRNFLLFLASFEGRMERKLYYVLFTFSTEKGELSNFPFASLIESFVSKFVFFFEGKRQNGEVGS